MHLTLNKKKTISTTRYKRKFNRYQNLILTIIIKSTPHNKKDFIELQKLTIKDKWIHNLLKKIILKLQYIKSIKLLTKKVWNKISLTSNINYL